MVKTRRSSRVNQKNPLDPFEDRKRHRSLGVHASGIQRRGQDTEECFHLLEGLFAHSVPGLWFFRILPVYDQHDDISVGLGIEWRYLLPLLTKCGLVRSKVTSVVKDVHVDVSQWHEMARAITKKIKMEVSAIRTKCSWRSYFFCVGTPQFRNPIEQARESRLIGMGSSSLPPRDIVLEAKKVANDILNRRLADRVRGGHLNLQNGIQGQRQAQQQEELNDEQVGQVATAVSAAIDFAAALDLDRRPRLSRSNAGKSTTTGALKSPPKVVIRILTPLLFFI